MTFEILTPTDATLTSVTPRTEKHGDDDVFAISLGLSITGANTMLDALSPSLRHALYMAVPDQEQLPGVEPATPLLRCKVMQEVKVGPSNLEGWTLYVDHGIDESEPITLGGCKVDKFVVQPSEGGTVVLKFRVGSNDVDATEAGLLCSHLGQLVSFTLAAPVIKKPEAGATEATGAAIDGMTGHPALAGQGSLLTPEEALAASGADASITEAAGAGAGQGADAAAAQASKDRLDASGRSQFPNGGAKTDDEVKGETGPADAPKGRRARKSAVHAE